MLRVYSGPTDRRPIMTQKDTQHTGAIAIAIETNVDPSCRPRRPNKEGAIEEQDDTIMSKAVGPNTKPQDCQQIKQADANMQIHSPNHSLKQTKVTIVPIASNKKPKYTTFYGQFHKNWHHEHVLGEGGDGVVHLYQQRKKEGKFIALKLPRCNYRSIREDLAKEIKNLRILDVHEHILHLCHATEDWFPYGPALFLPVCDLGDLVTYRESWCAQKELEGKPERVSEITMWKLFRDMVLALNYIHHELGTRYVHNDFKPQNVLAVTPPEHIGYGTPEEPIFKLSDFARLTPWPTPQGQRARGFDGTPEYAPPHVEQIAPVQTSADVWGLGATLQFMAFGFLPIQTREAFIRSRKALGKAYPELEDEQEWMSEYWRNRVPTVFRPIHVARTVLQKEYDLPDLPPDYQHYGARLGYWYGQLWKPVASRPKASRLVLQAIPHMDDQVERLKLERVEEKRHAKDCGRLMNAEVKDCDLVCKVY